jgi:MFS family permease
VSDTASPARAAPLQLLADRSFRRVWIAGALCGTMRWLDTLAVAVYVLNVTGSALQVALTLFLRTLPMLLFGVVAGALTEKLDRRQLLLGILAVLALTNAVLAWLAFTGQLEVWHLAAGVFISGLYWALELPTRRTMIADIAGIPRLAAAMGLESSTNNFTRMIGPMTGGLLFELFGIVGTQALGAFLYAAAFVLILAAAYEKKAAAAEPRSIVSDIREGLSFVRANRAVLATLTITVCLNLFGFPYISMVPVIAKQVLGLSPFPTGLLMSSEGFGALVGAMSIAFLATPSRFRQIYLGGSLVFLSCIVIFALSTSFWLTLPILCLSGFGMAGFGAMQSTLIVANSPPEMRNRIMGVLAMCIGVGPVGILIVGTLAEQFGPALGVLLISATGVTLTLACALAWPEMRRRREI